MQSQLKHNIEYNEACFLPKNTTTFEFLKIAYLDNHARYSKRQVEQTKAKNHTPLGCLKFHNPNLNNNFKRVILFKFTCRIFICECVSVIQRVRLGIFMTRWVVEITELGGATTGLESLGSSQTTGYFDAN